MIRKLSKTLSTNKPGLSLNCRVEYRYQHSNADSEDNDIIAAMLKGSTSQHKLEMTVKDANRAVKLRRRYLEELKQNKSIFESGIPIESIDPSKFYSQVNGANCECVVGFIPIPVGIAGPLLLDDVQYHIPMATTEGALIASTNRGARAIGLSGGATTVLFKDGMTRAPALQCRDLAEAAKVKAWIDRPENFKTLQEAFATTTRFGKLNSLDVKLAGRILFVKHSCTTGDAMGMNMIGKGSNEVVRTILSVFPHVKLLTLSGNLCTDKKPAAVNWIEGRGKSVAAEAVIPHSVVKNVLKTSVQAMVEVNTAKNLVGSAVAGAMGGNNAHAANMVTAVFLATGQDPAQNVESSNCLTFMEATEKGDLRISVTMPCVEVGTVGGGTSLPAQQAALQLLGVAGAHSTKPGANARRLARIVAGTVLAGELSLMAALSVNHLISAHMQLNRKPLQSSSATSATGSLFTEMGEAITGIGIGIESCLGQQNLIEALPKASKLHGSEVCEEGYMIPLCPIP